MKMRLRKLHKYNERSRAQAWLNTFFPRKYFYAN